MEVVVPLFALSSLYLINNQNKKKDETEEFANQHTLPNTNVADENYPVDSTETENTSNLSVLSDSLQNNIYLFVESFFKASIKELV